MSMELLVILSLASAPTEKEWQDALVSSNLPVVITEQVDLESHSGFLPMSVKGDQTGLYFNRVDYSEYEPYLPKATGFNIGSPIVFSLGYGGHFLECSAVFFSATALVKSFGAFAFDAQSGNYMNDQELSIAGEQCYQMSKTE